MDTKVRDCNCIVICCSSQITMWWRMDTEARDCNCIVFCCKGLSLYCNLLQFTDYHVGADGYGGKGL